MKKIFELEMEVKRAEEGVGVNISFAGGILGRVSEVMNKEDQEKLNKCVEEMSSVIRNIVLRDLLEGTGIDFQDVIKSGESRVITDEKEIEKELDKRRKSNTDILKKMREEKEEIYNSLSQKEKEEIDEYERELEKCKTIDEQIVLTLSKIEEILSR
ncbi:MAG: hypothetical protein IAC55_03365 [Tyzzerella sp.]|uniref:Uncharacterized protein n=1 Tax=Candidatus Fimicola merdigallinarum TaxID=2840819 RepID=A0A9D9H0S6_9FIRM|nr:hypothetical protein [Candidatus Fimicola merdigallinarum]